MKRIAVGQSLVEMSHLKNMLEQLEIACMIKNEQLAGALGDIPFLECQPELWVLDDRQAERARRFIFETQRSDACGEPWDCSACGETNEGQFAQCWQCGGAAPSI